MSSMQRSMARQARRNELRSVRVYLCPKCGEKLKASIGARRKCEKCGFSGRLK